MTLVYDGGGLVCVVLLGGGVEAVEVGLVGLGAG